MSHDTETGTYPEWVPNSPTINADNGSSVSSSFNVTIGEKLKSWLMAVAFVSAIAGNLLFGVLYLQAERKPTTVEDLKKYEFEYFKQTEWVDMKTNLEVTKQLVAAKCSK